MSKKENLNKNSKTKSKVEHMLMPEHIKISDEDKAKLFDYYNITIKDLPKINIKDAAIKHLDVKENDVVKIIRKSKTVGQTIFYRGVINE